ncbi:MAG: Ig-like domain-containing protein, partial [Candidatus Thorarchaeota archaeon]
MNSREIIAGLIVIVLIVSIAYVVFLVIQEPNDNPLDTTPPVVTILTPTTDTEVYGEIIISFNATDTNPILEYELRIDSVLQVNDTSYIWDTTTETDGTHSILCRAMDNSSNWGEGSISVTVNNTAHPNIAPVVTITAPTAGSNVSDYTLISTNVVDEDSLNARIYVDNERLSSTGSFLWNTKLWSNGIHTIIANVTDSGGLTGSDSIQVTVDNYVAQLTFDGELKVMAYNIEQGGIDPDWMNVVKEENADIMILVETGTWDDNSDLILRDSIEELNDYFVDEAPYSGYTAQGISYSTSGEAILSRFPILEFNQIGIVPLDDATPYDVTHDFIHAIVNINGTNVHLVGCHLKAMDGTTNEQRREWETEGIINYMDNLGNVPLMYLGDLNSFSPFDTGDLAPIGDGLGYGPLTMMLVPDDPTYGQY